MSMSSVDVIRDLMLRSSQMRRRHLAETFHTVPASRAHAGRGESSADEKSIREEQWWRGTAKGCRAAATTQQSDALGKSARMRQKHHRRAASRECARHEELG